MATTAKPPEIVTIRLGFSSAYLLVGRKSVLVDTGYPGSGSTIVRQLGHYGISPRDLSLILITHGHIDHYGSADELKRLTDTPTAIHRLDAQHTSQGLDAPVQPVGTLASLLFLLLKMKGVTSRPFKPDIFMDGEMTLDTFGVQARVLSTPGHTPGSLSIILDSGEALVGDLLMGGIIRRTKPHLPLFIENHKDLFDSLEKLAAVKPKKIFCSHGGPFAARNLFSLLSSCRGKY